MEKLILEILVKKLDKDVCKKIEFSPVPKGQKGDLAMKFFLLSKELKKSPIEIANEIKTFLETNNEFEKIEIAGAYLNLTFAKNIFFTKVLESNLQSKKLKNKKIVLEFSGPNTNKPLHLGHMRNHALGISMSNILENCGAKVSRVNIINDRGVHICKSMLSYQKFGKNKTPKSENMKGDNFVGSFYIKFEEESKKDENLNKEVQKMLLKWENNDPDIRELWEKMNNWTLAGHQKTYERQGVKFDKIYKESDYYLEGKKLAEKGLEKKIFYKRNDGAICIDLQNEGLDEKVILRADGTSIYLTQDLAVAVARFKDFKPDELIYTVADEQNYHFKVLFVCLEKLGLIPRKKCHHLAYGLVHLPEGRMKSREGTVVDADDLMDNLKKFAKIQIEERHKSLSEKETEEIAETIQNSAWKFFLLSTSPNKSITFDAEKSIKFEGATGPYLQYAGVRIKSILKKSENLPNLNSEEISQNLGENEKPLGVKILEFEKALDRSAENYNPTFLITYLLELSQTWSTYYAENSILKAKTEDLKNSRIFLAKKVLTVLEKGLNLLGIGIPEKM